MASNAKWRAVEVFQIRKWNWRVWQMVADLLIQVQAKGTLGDSQDLQWALCRESPSPRAPLWGEDSHLWVFWGIQVPQGVNQEGVVCRGEGCRAALPPLQLKTTNMCRQGSVTCSLWPQKLFSGPGDCVLAYLITAVVHEGPFQCPAMLLMVVDVICLVQPWPFLCHGVDTTQDYFVITPYLTEHLLVRL